MKWKMNEMQTADCVTRVFSFDNCHIMQTCETWEHWLLCTWYSTSKRFRLIIWSVDSLRPEQNGWHFVDYFQMRFPKKKSVVFLFKFYWGMSLGVQLAVDMHWFGLCFGTTRLITWTSLDSVHWQSAALSMSTYNMMSLKSHKICALWEI